MHYGGKSQYSESILLEDWNKSRVLGLCGPHEKTLSKFHFFTLIMPSGPSVPYLNPSQFLSPLVLLFRYTKTAQHPPPPTASLSIFLSLSCFPPLTMLFFLSFLFFQESKVMKRTVPTKAMWKVFLLEVKSQYRNPAQLEVLSFGQVNYGGAPRFPPPNRQLWKHDWGESSSWRVEQGV